MSIDKGDVLGHFFLFEEAVAAAGYEAVLGLRNFKVYVRGNGKDSVFHPRFLEIVNGGKCYTDVLTARTKRFIGWLPYLGKRWPAASDKLTFKRIATEGGLLTPAYSYEADARMEDVLIKRSASSFAATIKGPYQSTDGIALDKETGEYFEQFISGRIVKIWYWNNAPVCLELDECPRVEGDGRSTLRQLVQDRLSRLGRQVAAGVRSLDNVEAFLAFQGHRLDDVPASGHAPAVEFRYGSKLHADGDRQVIDLRRRVPDFVRSDLHRIGAVAWAAIPKAIRASTMFTVDAILDGEGRLWVLEMNSNPFVHPLVYQPMLASLLMPERQGESTLQ